MKIKHQLYNPSKEELHAELEFMYAKYEQLCSAYKRLASKMELTPKNEVHDMSHMTFEQTTNNKEMI